MRNLISFYKDRGTADQVSNELLAAGFSRGDVHIYEGKGRDNGTAEEERGLWEKIKDAFGFASENDRQLYAEAARRGGVAVSLDIDDQNEDATEIDNAVKIMRRHNPMDLRQSEAQWRAQGWQGYAGAPAIQTPPVANQTIAGAAGGTEAIPVIEEQLQIGTRRVALGGVRVHSRVIETPVEKEVELRQEQVKVERRPANRPVTDADRAFQERTIEATESVEEPVVRKQARVVEEVKVNREVEQHKETVRDTVRRTDVQVEQMGKEAPQGAAQGVGSEEFANELATDQRYMNRDWNAVEPDARVAYEHRYPHGKWEGVRDSIRQTFESRRGSEVRH